jgi:hypothetical protein
MRTAPVVQRDDGLRRVSTLTRWVAGSSAAAAGLFALLAAHPKLPRLPTLRVDHTAEPGAGGFSANDGSSAQGDPNAPAQAPAQAIAPVQVVSGSS